MNVTAKFIVLYGINNLGKTLQSKKLVEFLQEKGYEAEYIKYPIYNLLPSGWHINAYLRGGNPHNLSIREVQILYALNRTQYEKTLLSKLGAGIWIVAEDYTATSLGWGGKENIDFLRGINSHLVVEDLSILFYGQRFVDGIETNHTHESDDERVLSVQEIFRTLANNGNWPIINANKNVEEVSKNVQRIVVEKLRI